MLRLLPRVAALLLLLALSAPPAGAMAVQRMAGQTMGTTWSVSLQAGGQQLPALHAGVQERLDEADAQMSTWALGADLSAYDRAPAGSGYPLPPATREA